MKLTKLFGNLSVAAHLLLSVAMAAGLVWLLWQIHVANQTREIEVPMVIVKPQNGGPEKVFITIESAMRHTRTGDTVTLNPGLYEAVYKVSNQP